MTVRDATYSDVPGIVALIGESFGRSKYARAMSPAGVAGAVDVKEAKRLLVQSIQRHGGEHIGSTLVLVAEAHGTVQGVLLAVLDRVLGIGNLLYATDLFFFASPLVDPRDPSMMIGTMERWAFANPRVLEMVLGITDVLADPDRTSKLYERAGYRRIGHLYQKERGA